MTLRQFVRENREMIDRVIHNVCGDDFKIDNAEREEWVRNDNGLYTYAQGCGWPG
jgi:hypothetical protein